MHTANRLEEIYRQLCETKFESTANSHAKKGRAHERIRHKSEIRINNILFAWWMLNRNVRKWKMN